MAAGGGRRAAALHQQAAPSVEGLSAVGRALQRVKHPDGPDSVCLQWLSFHGVQRKTASCPAVQACLQRAGNDGLF